MNQFESDSDSGQVLVRIFTTNLIWVEHCESGRRALLFVRHVVIGDDHVETVFARPVEWFMSANAAVDADDQRVTIGYCLFDRRLLNTVAFGKAMRDMKADV